MVRYLPDWPISDPSIDYNAKHQVNQYIYYPKENGQKFFLYAHLEAPTKAEQIDYNQQDNLLRAWGAYNYRVTSGQEQPSTVQQIPHPQHAKPAPPAGPNPVTTVPASTPEASVTMPQPEPINPTPPASANYQAQPAPAMQPPQQTVATPVVPTQPAAAPDPLTPSIPEPQLASAEPVIAAMPPVDQPAATNSEPPVIDPNPDNNQPV